MYWQAGNCCKLYIFVFKLEFVSVLVLFMVYLLGFKNSVHINQKQGNF